MAPKAFQTHDNKVIGGDGKADEMIVNLSSQNSTCVPNIGATEERNFLTPDAKKAFKCLRQAFIKAPILQHFDPKSHIQIEIDVLGYAIGEILSQLNFEEVVLSDFGQWHLVAYFFKKMILAKTQ